MKKHILLLLALCGVQSHAGRLLTTTKSAAAKLEDQRNKSDQNHQQEIANLKSQHEAELAKQKAEHEAELAKLKPKQTVEPVQSGGQVQNGAQVQSGGQGTDPAQKTGPGNGQAGRISNAPIIPPAKKAAMDKSRAADTAAKAAKKTGPGSGQASVVNKDLAPKSQLSLAEQLAEQSKKLKTPPTKEEIAAENANKDVLKQQVQPKTQVRQSNMEAMNQQLAARQKALSSRKNVSRDSDSSDDETSDSD